ncbi:PIN domain-containing protein [Anaeromyxobacter sp. K]|uniref:PIN domain-containing protein n=1 Tax=Anaeromyxobacter sp. (strain K) TaxID=447217 RepID=UPI0018DBD51C|nr:PIN domain-containing protein [Anaeromyxobacter sp. K]
MLIDTCVWLDLAKEPKQTPALGVIEQLVRRGLLTLIVPRVLLDEFRRNRDRVARESARSLATHFRVVKDAVTRAGGDKRRLRGVLAHLDNVDHKIPLVGSAAEGVLDRIETLLTATPAMESSDAAKLLALQRALDKKAPFHHPKNAMADALLIEAYAECVRDRAASGTWFSFITHNKSDFSAENGDQRLPHPDFAAYFSRTKSRYFINLPAALRRVEPSMVSDILVEESWSREPRTLAEILEAEDLLFHQVWYNRHWNLRIGVERGEIKVVEKETYPRPPGAPETVQRDVWQGALKSAKRVEQRYGKKNLGPWDDFEWGMINGKLSALRWILGDEWDFLDT